MRGDDDEFDMSDDESDEESDEESHGEEEENDFDDWMSESSLCDLIAFEEDSEDKKKKKGAGAGKGKGAGAGREEEEESSLFCKQIVPELSEWGDDDVRSLSVSKPKKSSKQKPTTSHVLYIQVLSLSLLLFSFIISSFSLLYDSSVSFRWNIVPTKH